MAITIRNAELTDADAISRLVCALSERFVCPSFEPSARQALLDSMSVEKIRGYLDGAYDYVVAVTPNDELVGVAGLRDNSHLYHLFVRAEYHGQGIAQRLWEQLKNGAIKKGNTGHFSVNSAVNAERVYLRFGFRRVDGVSR